MDFLGASSAKLRAKLRAKPTMPQLSALPRKRLFGTDYKSLSALKIVGRCVVALKDVAVLSI